jgi:hypothetical protein
MCGAVLRNQQTVSQKLNQAVTWMSQWGITLYNMKRSIQKIADGNGLLRYQLGAISLIALSFWIVTLFVG